MTATSISLNDALNSWAYALHNRLVKRMITRGDEVLPMVGSEAESGSFHVAFAMDPEVESCDVQAPEPEAH